MELSSNNRSKEEILQDIENLCKSRGYAHALAFLCLETNYMPQDALNDHKKRINIHWETLLRTEIELLIGFMIKGEMSNALSDIPQKDIKNYIKKSKKLLSELHETLNAKVYDRLPEILKNEDKVKSSDDFKNVLLEEGLKESFFYGAETAYEWQYEEFFLKKYMNDDDWLYKEKGFRSKDAKKITSVITEIIRRQVECYLLAISFQKNKGQIREPEYYLKNLPKFNELKTSTLPIFIIQKENIIQESAISSEIVEKILDAFSIGIFPCNEKFNEHGDFNKFNKKPLIKIDDKNYISFQPRNLLKAIYQTPYFWMFESSYKNQANENRGKFVESTVAELFKKVFGESNVYENIEIPNLTGKNNAGEIDILVVYANRAIVVQTKAKNMILKAIKGDVKEIKNDFQKAIQDPYEQSFDCSTFLLNKEYILLDKDGNKLNIRRDFVEIFTMCIVGDTYHGLANQLPLIMDIKEHDIIHKPYITDLFVLDTLCEFLDTPTHFLNFQHKKAMYFKNIICSNELSILAYYLKDCLFLTAEEKENNLLHIEDDFCCMLDEAFMSRKNNLKNIKTPEGILTKFNGTFFEVIIEDLNNHEDDKNVELTYFFLDLSEKAIAELSDTFKKIIQTTNEDKSLHDFVYVHEDSAIIAHVSFASDIEASKKLLEHCEMVKYRYKLKLCFGILLNTNPKEFPFRMFLYNNSPWENSE